MIPVVVLGLGPIGLHCVELILQRPYLKLVGVVDIDPNKQGKDLGEILEKKPLGLKISKDLSEIKEKIQVALLTTSSKVEHVLPSLKQLAEQKISVVSSCEELFYISDEKQRQEVDELAKKSQTAIVATGVNPGFVMDFLPLALSSVTQKVESVVVERFQNAQSRRKPFQDKIGAGLSMAEFEQKKKNLGHVGLRESALFLMQHWGFSLGKYAEKFESVLSENKVQGVYQQGIFQDAQGVERVRLEFRASMIEEKSIERIILKGHPSFEMNISGGIQGDVATVAILVNALSSVLKASPGFHTMASCPVPHFRNE